MNTFSNFYYLYRWINIDVFVNKDLRLKVSWGNKQTKVKMHLHRTLIDRDRKSGITKPRHEFIKNIEKFERPWIPWFVSNWYVVWKSLYMLVRKKFLASVKDFILLHTWQSLDLFAKIVTVNHSHYLRKYKCDVNTFRYWILCNFFFIWAYIYMGFPNLKKQIIWINFIPFAFISVGKFLKWYLSLNMLKVLKAN